MFSSGLTRFNQRMKVVRRPKNMKCLAFSQNFPLKQGRKNIKEESPDTPRST